MLKNHINDVDMRILYSVMFFLEIPNQDNDFAY